MSVKKYGCLGFSLLEMLMVVALLALLSSLAYGGWQTSWQKTQRIDAQQSLYQWAITLTTCFQSSQDYRLCAQSLHLSATQPVLSQQGYFEIFLTEVSAKHYALRAQSLYRKAETYDLSR